MYAFDATTSAYVTSTASAPDGAYSLVLPVGSYKLYVPPPTAGYADQWYGGATATVVPVSGATTGDIGLVPGP